MDREVLRGTLEAVDDRFRRMRRLVNRKGVTTHEEADKIVHHVIELADSNVRALDALVEEFDEDRRMNIDMCLLKRWCRFASDTSWNIYNVFCNEIDMTFEESYESQIRFPEGHSDEECNWAYTKMLEILHKYEKADNREEYIILR